MGYSFSVSIKGKTQGAFKAETTQGQAKNKIAGLSFSYEVKSPRDAATGNASGKRQHSPVRIVKAVGAASPQIFQALVNNEVLTEVTFEFTKTNSNGEEYVYYQIKLTNASVASVRLFTKEDLSSAGGSSSKQSSSLPMELEEVAFVFHKIEVENKDGKTMGMDDWSGPNT